MTDFDPAVIAVADQGIARHREHIREMLDEIRAYRATVGSGHTVIGIPNRTVAWLAATPPIQLVGLVLVLLDQAARRPEQPAGRDQVDAAAAVLGTCYAGDPATHRAAAQALADAGLLATGGENS
jgi:hypothetical protein